VHIKGNTEMCA